MKRQICPIRPRRCPTMVTVRAAGIDTWKACWYVDADSDAERAMNALATAKSRRGYLMPEAVGGHRIGWEPGHRLVYAEGHPDAEGLGCPADSAARIDALVDDLAGVGVQLQKCNATTCEWPGMTRRAGLAGLGRLDATVDLQADTA